MEDSTIFTSPSTEPTNEELWQQPPEETSAPDGVYVLLDKARQRYTELDTREVRAYKNVSSFHASGSEFVVSGDMPLAAALRLQTAISEKHFNVIRAYVPRSELRRGVDPAIIGRIDSVGQARYFLINEQRPQMWSTSAVAKWSDEHWWADRIHTFVFWAVIGAAFAIGLPVMGAIVLHDLSVLWWMIATGFIAVIMTGLATAGLDEF